MPGQDYTPVITPNGAALPWKVVDGVKVYHLIAEDVLHELAPGIKAHCWGTTAAFMDRPSRPVEGERVRIYVTNKLDAPTSLHPHGVSLPAPLTGKQLARPSGADASTENAPPSQAGPGAQKRDRYRKACAQTL